MWQSYFNGLGLSAGLIIAIGAQNLFVLAQGLRREHPLAVALVCAACDALLVCAGVFGLARALAASPLVLEIARWGGALFLLVYAVGALRRAWQPQAMAVETSQPVSRQRVVLATLAVSLLNPHVYLDTVVLLGSLGANQTMPGAFAAGAVSTSLLWFCVLALGAARLSPWLARPTLWRWINLLVALVLLAIAVQLVVGGTPAG